MDIKNYVFSDQGLQALDNGAWVSDVGGDPDFSLLVRGLRSDPVRKATEAKQAKIRAKKKGKDLTPEEVTQVFKEVICEKVLLGWKGLESDGQEIPYDPELAKSWIMERTGEKFTNLVITAAQSLDESPDDFIEAAAKN